MVCNEIIAGLLKQTMEEIGQEAWSEDEIKWAKKMNEPVENQRQNVIKRMKLDPDTQLYTGVAPMQKGAIYASTDVGDVAHIVPTAMANFATTSLGAPGHSWQIAAASGGSIGLKGMIYAAKTLAASGVRLAEDPKLRGQARAEFDEMMNGETYVCPIPKGMKLPQ